MLVSMTGCGIVSLRTQEWEIDISLRTINSKIFDCTLRIDRALEGREMQLRSILSDAFVRGKIILSIECNSLNNEPRAGSSLNRALFQSYWRMLQDASSSLGVKVSEDTLLGAVLRMPHLMSSDTRLGKEEEEALWQHIQAPLQEAINECQQMQRKEGQKTATQIQKELQVILQFLEQIRLLEHSRTEAVTRKLHKKVEEIRSNSSEDRFEQELFFYLERMDFTEEKERLQHHIDFFKDILQESEPSEAKRLLFLSQEIGRELNTLGSKAHHAQIQHYVVEMKTALEHIKEQLHNLR